MPNENVVLLSNGVRMPAIGFGTAELRGTICVDAVKNAIAKGYRLIDTASAYKNEEPVGIAVRNCGINREELFINSKVWNNDHGYESTLQAFNATLQWSKLDYLDSYIIHWPNPAPLRDIGYVKHNAETWRAMEELYAKSKVRVIGVSNFMVHHLDALMADAKIKPMINQICLHPGNVDWETVNYCRKHNIILQAYAPLGIGRVLSHDVIIELSQKYKRTPAQVCLRWHIQQGFVPLPRSSNMNRMESNLKVFDFELEEKDVERLTNLPNVKNVFPHPDEATF